MGSRAQSVPGEGLRHQQHQTVSVGEGEAGGGEAPPLSGWQTPSTPISRKKGLGQRLQKDDP